MIKNVVFDFGQTLVRFEPHYMVGQYVTDQSDAALLTEVVFDRLYWDRLDADAISDEELIAAFHARLPSRLWATAEEIYSNWIYHLPEIDGMTALVSSLKIKGLGVYLISNISRYFAEHADEIPVLRLLDGCVFSATCGRIKPNRDIFEHFCRRFSLLPEACLFVDDRADNIRGAKAVGMMGYVFDGDAKRLAAYIEKQMRGTV